MIRAQRSFISILIALTVLLGSALVPAYAVYAVTNEQVATQENVVRTHLLATMEEQLKLLQMLLIQRLEERVAQLTAAQ